ncbi:MAG: hypothetical protein M0P09_01520 [Acholeplasmataceae bacterium]|nr:hypothetical protein [Acholeplasmataceae bacterium]
MIKSLSNPQVLKKRPKADTSAPIDTTTQSGLAVLEDVLNFTTTRLEKAEHLDKAETFMAAHAQEEPGDGKVKLAEITIETLREELIESLEDCDECNSLSTGLENLTTNELIGQTLVVSKNILTDVSNMLYKASNDLVISKELIQDRLSTLLEKVTHLKDVVKLPDGQHPSTKVDINKAKALLYLTDTHAKPSLIICLAGEIWKQSYYNTILPLMESNEQKLSDLKELLKEAIKDKMEDGSFISLEGIETDEHTVLISQLTKGDFIAFDKRDNRFLILEKGVNFLDGEVTLPTLTTEEIFKSLNLIKKSLIDSCVGEILNETSNIQRKVFELHALLMSYFTGVTSKNYIEEGELRLIIEEVKNYREVLNNNVIFYYQYANKLVNNIILMLDVLESYLEG